MDIILLPHYTGTTAPEFKTPLAAGVDLFASHEEAVTLAPGEDYVFPTGIKIDITSIITPDECTFDDMLAAGINVYGMVLPRSGLGFKHYTRLANTAGVIDADYQGEIMIKIRNEGDMVFTVEPGDRICQMVFQVCMSPFAFNVVEQFKTKSERGEGGFGSTGV